jgi:hypothetical protein
MTPSSDHNDLEGRLTVMLRQRAAAVEIESDADAVIAHAVTVRERRSSRPWLLVAAATIVMLPVGLVALGALRDPDRAQTDEVLPTAPPVSSVPSTTPVTVAPTTTSAVAEPVTGSPADGLVIVAANAQWGGGQFGDLYLLVPGEAPRMIVGAPGDDVAQHCPQLSTNGRFVAWGEGAAAGGPLSLRGVSPVVDRTVVIAPITSDGTVSEPIVRVSVPDGSGEMTCPQWAPDGSAVAYRADGDVWITDSVDGTTTVVDAEPLFDPDASEEVVYNGWSVAEVAWSNDSSRIAASEQGQVRIIDVATGSSDVKDTGRSVPRHLDWLSADQKIIYWTNEDEPGNGAGQQDIVVASVDGTGGGETILRSLPPPGDNESYNFDSPALSPDGNRVAVLHTTFTCDNEGCSPGPTQVLVIDLTTFTIAPIPLPDERYASTVQWSPDGRRLLLSSLDGVFSVPVDGQGPTVTFAAGADIDLEWSYDEITWRVPS